MYEVRNLNNHWYQAVNTDGSIQIVWNCQYKKIAPEASRSARRAFRVPTAPVVSIKAMLMSFCLRTQQTPSSVEYMHPCPR